jgi:ubiquitin-like modifier-activating enzyme ATG7
MNKADLMNSEGKKLLQRIRDGSALEDPSELTRFHIAAFSDLKKYKFYYWFAFPAISCDAVFGSQSALQGDEVKKMSDAVETYANSTNDIKQLGFFLVKAVPEGYVIGQLKHYKDFFKESEEVRVGFVDPCTIEGVPGWPLRNFLVLLVELGVRKVKILSYRDHAHTDTGSKSFWIDVEIAGIAKVPKVTGWERNAAGKLAPKMSDLGALVNPEQLANQAVDLNLRLMKWRIAPEVDLDSIQNARCLLLGAGTLGSYIARGLLAWGVRNVTFVDNGKVSFSNPVRQSLYRFEHCLDGGAPKAATAAAVLNEIFPAVTASGYQLEIPMAGHTLSNEARQHKEYDELVSLIESHDVVFLLMDSRESRWLPTVIASALSKLVINVALGFDSYLVMRHGISEPNSDEHHPHLGCYFCNDVVAPVDVSVCSLYALITLSTNT